MSDTDAIEVTTDVERRLLGALGGFVAMTTSEVAATVFGAAGLDAGAIDTALHGPGRDRVRCTIRNLFSHSVGDAMEPHAAIHTRLKEQA